MDSISKRKIKNTTQSFLGTFIGLTLALQPVSALAEAPLLSSMKPKPVAATVPRPPQYVALAFDGSKSVPMWNETRAFAKDMTARGKPLKFTYFINADYYLANQYRDSYDAPGLGLGKSAIGFGDQVNDVLNRFDQTNLAFQEGNEIANHAAGHFNGSTWTGDEWTSEFSQFFDLIFNVFKYNHASYTRAFPTGWVFNQSEMVGFRAPNLGQNAALFQTLPKFGVQYDTSLTASSIYWPRKNAQGIWNFPLSSILIAGTAKKTLSMDYNFYYSQSGAKEDPANGAQYEDQMYKSYLAYFQQNYNGNRAPLNIGHHFAQWNAGAYWRAEKHFAETVCGLPDVKCVTYRELMQFMNQLSPATIDAYSAGRFTVPVPVPIHVADNVKFFNVDLSLSAEDNGQLTAHLGGSDLWDLRVNGSITRSFRVNKVPVREEELSIGKLRSLTPTGGTAEIEALVFAGSRELQKKVYRMREMGTANESTLEKHSQELIADPPEAHDELNADKVTAFR